MLELIVYLNNDVRQPLLFSEPTVDAMMKRLKLWIEKNQPDVALNFGGQDDPLATLNWCELYGEYEYRAEGLDEVDVDASGAEAVTAWLERAKEFVRPAKGGQQ